MKHFARLTTAALFLLVAGAAATVYAGGKKEITAPVETAAVSDTVLDIKHPEILRAAALNGPSGMGMAYLFENKPELGETPSSFETAASADVLLPKLLKGELDIGILPPNAAAKVYTKNKGAIVMGAVVGEGMLSVITKDAQVSSLRDLAGKKVTVAGQGATPEYLLRYLLDAQGIPVAGTTAGNAGTAGTAAVELDFSIPAAEIAVAIISDKIAYAVVPEPFSTVAEMRDAAVIRAVDVQKVFSDVRKTAPDAATAGFSSNYPMTVVVIRREFAENYPETVREFLEAYKNAIAWTNANPADAGALVQKHTLGLQAPVAAKAIPRAAFVFRTAAEARPEVEFLLSLFLDFAPESIGGVLPDDGFYFR